MDNKSEVSINNSSIVGISTNWLFGVVVFAIGIINTFWGNDPGFGVFIIVLSFVYFPPASNLFKKITGFAIPLIVKIILGVFILWAALGVGELFDKIELMKMDL